MEKVRPLNTDLSIHKQDLKEAVYYLPEAFEQELLFKALKVIYQDEEGKDLAMEYLHKRHLPVPSNFDGKWTESNLTKFQKHDLDSFLNKNIYDIAKETGWIPKAFRKGKNSKRPPSKRSLAIVEQDLNAKERLEESLTSVKERKLGEDEKSFIPPQIMNLDGACYDHPYLKKSDIPKNHDDYLGKLDKIVDCEVIVEEAIETLIKQPGQLEDDKTVSFRIRLNNKQGNEVLTRASFEELTTMTRFSSFLVSKGFVKFKGTKLQFDRFHEFLIKEQDYPTVRILSNWGEFKPGLYLFKNGLFDVKENTFYPADEKLRIRYKNRLLICPDGNELVQPPILSIPKDEEASKQFLAEKFGLWESFNGRLIVRSTLGYAISCIFNRAIKDENDNFPLLFKFGERGTGKSTSMDWFMALFGYKNGNRQSVSKQNTIKGMLRNMTLPVGFPFFLDDYRSHQTNSQVPELTTSILNWYGQTGVSMAKKTTDHQTVETPMKASVVMTGNDKPTGPAVLSRFIILNYSKFLKKDELLRVPEVTQHIHRFSEFTAHILKSYDKAYEAFIYYQKQNKKWLANQNFEGRTVNNWSIVLSGIQTIPMIFPGLSHWKNEFEALRIEICQAIKKEEALQKEANPLHDFFDAIEYYATQKFDPESEYNNRTNVLDHRHFRCKVGQNFLLPTGENYTGYILYLSLNGIWNVLQNVHADITRTTTLNMLETKLQNSSYYLEHGVQTILTKSIGEAKESNRRCYAINVEQLTKNQKLGELIEKAHQYEQERPLRLK